MVGDRIRADNPRIRRLAFWYGACVDHRVCERRYFRRSCWPARYAPAHRRTTATVHLSPTTRRMAGPPVGRVLCLCRRAPPDRSAWKRRLLAGGCVNGFLRRARPIRRALASSNKGRTTVHETSGNVARTTPGSPSRSGALRTSGDSRDRQQKAPTSIAETLSQANSRTAGRWCHHAMGTVLAVAAILYPVALSACDSPGECVFPAVSTGAGFELLPMPQMEIKGAQATLTGPVTDTLLCVSYPYGGECSWSGATPLAAGTYTLQVSAPGYQAVTTQVELTISSACGRTWANVQPYIISLGSCTPMSVSMACQGKTCGEGPDGCGGMFNCGACAAGDACNAGSCCTPMSVSTACQGKACGEGPDGCGGTVSCGACP